jgi:hypothetical protein
MLSEKSTKGYYSHPYSYKVGHKTKHFWAETSLSEAAKAGSACGLRLVKGVPIKFLSDNLMFGKMLGHDKFYKINAELQEKLRASQEICEFYGWLERNYFQSMEPQFSYHNLLIFEKR